MIKAVFIDIDGTLMSHTIHDVPKSTKLAIELMQEKGLKVCLATGRHIKEIEKLPFNDIPFDGYICVNGQLCLNAQREIYFASPIKKEALEKYKHFFKDKAYALYFCEKDHLYVNYVNEKMKIAQTDISSAIPDIGEYTGNPVYLIVAYASEDEEKELKRISKGCKITRWNRYGIDIYDEYGGKEEGIRQFLKLNNITEDEIMTFGDGENDMLMIQMAKIGIAMGNGDEALKQVADYVTDDVDNDGIYNALKHFEVI